MSELVDRRVATAIAQVLFACGALKHATRADDDWAMGPSILAARAAVAAMRPNVDRADDEARAIEVANVCRPADPVQVLHLVETWIDEALR